MLERRCTSGCPYKLLSVHPFVPDVLVGGVASTFQPSPAYESDISERCIALKKVWGLLNSASSENLCFQLFL